MKEIAAITAFWVGAVFLVTPSVAGFVDNYSQWRKLDPGDQVMYVTGLTDGVTNALLWGDDETSQAISAGINECAFEIKLNPGMITEAISKYYADHTDKWGAAPSVVFVNAIAWGPCFDHVNRARVDRKLKPWPKPKS